jgi:hypothetical protein
MPDRNRRWLRLAAWLLVLLGGIGLLARPSWGPLWVFPGIATTIWPLCRAWRGASGTALRWSVAWAFAAILLGLLAQVVGLDETWDSGRPRAGHIAYLSTLATLAASTSILNARRPGSGAWAMLMALLVLVFLVPWLEGAGLVRSPMGWERLRLNAPWTIFYGLLVLTGITNYFPTRFSVASLWLAVALILAYLGLTRTGWFPSWRGWTWSASPWFLSLAIWTADAVASRKPIEIAGFDRLWFWFRDHWGVVWALRVQERFNRTAQSSGWPIRLTWQGSIPASGSNNRSAVAVPQAAEATLKMLLRRFADETRLDAESQG